MVFLPAPAVTRAGFASVSGEGFYGSLLLLGGLELLEGMSLEEDDGSIGPEEEEEGSIVSGSEEEDGSIPGAEEDEGIMPGIEEDDEDSPLSLDELSTSPDELSASLDELPSPLDELSPPLDELPSPLDELPSPLDELPSSLDELSISPEELLAAVSLRLLSGSALELLDSPLVLLLWIGGPSPPTPLEGSRSCCHRLRWNRCRYPTAHRAPRPWETPPPTRRTTACCPNPPA